MCVPPPVLMLAATAVSAIGSGVGALQANAMAGYRANVAERNAALEREGQQLDQEAMRRDALNHYRRVAALKGEQRAAAAANGVSTEFGTAADLGFDTDMMAREDIQALYGQGFQQMRGRDRSISNFMAERRAAKAEGRAALVKGAFDIAGTVLGGATQYKSMALNYGKVAKTGGSRAFGGAAFPNPGPNNYWSG